MYANSHPKSTPGRDNLDELAFTVIFGEWSKDPGEDLPPSPGQTVYCGMELFNTVGLQDF